MSPATSPAIWYYLENGQPKGPLSEVQLVDLIRRGVMPAGVMVCQSGWTQWSPANTIFARQLTGPIAVPPPASPPPAAPTIPIRCLSGPDAGKSFQIGANQTLLGRAAGLDQRDPHVADRHVTLFAQNGTLYFRAIPGCQIGVNNMGVTEGNLILGQQFQIGTSLWQVGDNPASAGDLLAALGNRLNSFASTDKLEGFSLSQMFSEVFKKRTPEELEDYFIVGTYRTTPQITEVETGWPKPWFFMRVLAFLALIYLGLLITFQQFQNPNLVPGLIMMGALAVPLGTVFLFFELNTPRNVAFHKVLMLVCVGGVVSLFVSLIGFQVSVFGWLGASQAGIVEEIGKLITVIIVARGTRYKYILNGILCGAAVGAGFAAFESAGYAFRILWESHSPEAMMSNITLRAFLTPFGHVAWTAIAAGALWRIKQDRPFNPSMLMDIKFLKAFCIPMILHMLWNSPLPSPFLIRHLVLGALGWYIVFGLVQQGLRQVKGEQQVVTTVTTGMMRAVSA